MIVFDTTVAAIAFDKNAAVPLDPKTNAPLTQCKERIDLLLTNLAAQKVRVLLPTPVVAEYIVGGGLDKEKRLAIITANKNFLIAPFDLRAAIECALIEDGDRGKQLNATQTKAKLKFDRQIIAVAIAQSADTIYTGDTTLGARAKDSSLSVVYTWDLPLPPEAAQMKIIYDPPEEDQPRP